MEFHQLELFLGVMEHLSVTKAAQQAHLSPGAISLQMRQLASELHADLFVRSGKRLLPTPAAVRLAEHARQLVCRMREIEAQFENDGAGDARPIRFATGATTLIHRLRGPLQRLRKEFRDTAIRITVSATEEMVQGLLSGRFDLALVSLPFDAQNLDVFPLFDEEFLILRPSPAQIRSPRTGSIQVADLSQARFMLYPQSSNMRTVIDGFFRGLGISPQVITEADDTEALKRLVESGLGYSILPASALRNGSRFFQTFRVPGHRLVRTQALAMARTGHPRALTRRIASFLREALKEDAGRGIRPGSMRDDSD